MSSSELTVGSIVDVQAGRGTVKFVGNTSFAPGKWIGIELHQGGGKNDGSVQGVQYFEAKPGSGIFVKPSQVRVTEGSTKAARRTSIGGAGAITRTSSMRSTPSVASGSSRPTSPLKHSVPSSRPAGATLLRRPSGAVSATSGDSRPGSSLNVTSSRPPSSLNVSAVRKASAEQDKENGDQTIRRRVSSPQPPPLPRSASPLLTPMLETSMRDDDQEQEQDSLLDDDEPPSIAKDTHIHRLETQLKLLATRHESSLSQIATLQHKLNEAETFIQYRPKLQAKLQSLQSELTGSKQLLGESTTRNKTLESRLVEMSEQLEMAHLDREVAEERAEGLGEECEDLKRKVGDMDTELMVLRNEVKEEEGKEPGGEARGGSGEMSRDSRRKILVLEKQNERMKEVLLRLRDSTQETESEHLQKIASLERELSGVDELHVQYEEALSRLQLADSNLEDLKGQLDDALDAEEMLVGLTERNLSLTEKNEDLRLTIEELEQLKELADELEEHHVETERVLEEEIAHKDVQVHELKRMLSDMKDELTDYEGTIGQFRDLVGTLQSDLASYRTLSLTAQSESASQASHTASLLTLNLRLQSSALKSRTKQIDSELLAFEAAETKDLLGIVQPYLPRVYVESDSDPTNCYLFFVRLGRKCEVIMSVVGEMYGIKEVLGGAEGQAGEVTDVIVGVCEMRTHMVHLSILCRRFGAVLRRADVETFMSMGRLFPEIAPLERRVDMHIDLLKRDQFRERECAADVGKILLQLEHIAETYFNGFASDLGERALDLAQSLDCDLDMFVAAMGLTKTALERLIKEDDIAAASVSDEADPEVLVSGPLQQLLDQCKGAKGLSRKLVKRIDDLIEGSTALKDTLLPRLGNLNGKVSAAVDFGIQLAQSVGQYIADVRASKETFNITRVVGFVREISHGCLPRQQDEGGVWNGIADTLMQLVQETGAVLPLVMDAENVIKITGTAPWLTRVNQIQEQLAVNVEADRKMAQLNEEIQTLARGIKTRDQNIQESTVKIQLQERRLEASKKQIETIADLENELVRARSAAQLLDQQVLQSQEEANQLRNDLARAQAAGGSEKRSANHAAPFATVSNFFLKEPSGRYPAEVSAITLEGNLETSYLLEQIEALRGTVRFLRSENLFIKGQDLLREVKELPPLRPRSRAPPTPPPEDQAKTLSDSDDTDSDTPTIRHQPTHKSLTVESKLLYSDFIDFASNARVVDLSVLNKTNSDDQYGMQNRAWMPKKQTPLYQISQRRRESELLSKRLKHLLDQASSVGIIDR